MLRNYLKIAWRNIRRHPSTSLIHVLGLCFGILSCLIIFIVIRYELGFNKVADAPRIYRVTTDLQSHLDNGPHHASSIPGPATQAMRAEMTGMEAITYFHTWNPGVTIAQDGEKPLKFDPLKGSETAMNIVITDPDYFHVFAYDWLEGNPRTALNDPFKVVLTESGARRYFGDAPLAADLGRTVAYDDSLIVTVSGIVRDPAAPTDLAFTDFISFATATNSYLGRGEVDMKNWHMWGSLNQTYVKLAPGVTIAQLQRQAPGFIDRHIKMDGMKTAFRFQPLSDLHYNGDYRDTYSRQASLPALYGMLGIACFILIIACINFINLSTAQSIQRAREIGVRKVMGSGRGQLVVQFLTETLMLTVLSAALALLLVRPVMAALGDLLPWGVAFHWTTSTLLFIGGIILVTAAGAGFYPARVVASFLPVISLKGKGGEQFNRRSPLRRALIVFQFTVSLVFIIGSIVVGRQLAYVLNSDLGFARGVVLQINTRWGDGDKRVYFAQRLRALAGVSRVSLNDGVPSSSRHGSTSFSYNGKQIVETKGELMDVDTAYFGLFGLRMIAGRQLMSSDTMKEYVINETAARTLGFPHPQDAVGKMVKAGMTDGSGLEFLPIVGVVSDFHSLSMHSAIEPVFMCAAGNEAASVSVKLTVLDQHTLNQIEALFHQVFPVAQYNPGFFDDIIARMYMDEQKTSRIISLAMTIAIFISCMGLFGLAAFTAQQRTKEVGIRKVLGARVSTIVVLLCRDFVLLVGLSILIASPIAWWASHRWLQDFAYRVPVSAWIFIVSGLAAIFIALCTVSAQALRVARANPVKSLRSE
ncbi:MAG TPA: ABC transporter permease [Dinghuibacter sp.]|uniref:ABC transporter permease n=1 Tax=Dinghuibacter sp. TaxID=2024697 RepID=UPI002D1CCCB8|nr:ABC transporter permease [Dinghuibacter sp.]HTJ11715.1 ABC transporter permease [Dinghuibacter sp.]